MISLFSCLSDFLAIFPIRFNACENSDPLIDRVLNIDEKTKVVFFHFRPILRIVECAFAYHKFIPILIEVEHENGQCCNNNTEQTPSIRENLIDFADGAINSDG